VADEHGDGWWIASDGKWYPPEARPTVPSPEGDRTEQVPAAASPPAWGAPPQQQAPAWGATPQPPPPTWGASPYGQPPSGPMATAPAAPSNGMAIAALVLGIGSLLFALIPFVGFASVPFAIAAVVLGVIGLGKARELGQGKGLAIGGLVTGALALAVSVLYVLLFVVIADEADDEGINTDPSNGVCNADRFLQDPDC
jgi:hypothetical protein